MVFLLRTSMLNDVWSFSSYIPIHYFRTLCDTVGSSFASSSNRYTRFFFLAIRLQTHFSISKPSVHLNFHCDNSCIYGLSNLPMLFSNFTLVTVLFWRYQNFFGTSRIQMVYSVNNPCFHPAWWYFPVHTVCLQCDVTTKITLLDGLSCYSTVWWNFPNVFQFSDKELFFDYYDAFSSVTWF